MIKKKKKKAMASKQVYYAAEKNRLGVQLVCVYIGFLSVFL